MIWTLAKPPQPIPWGTHPLPGRTRFYVVCRWTRDDGFVHDGFCSQPRWTRAECEALIARDDWRGGVPRIMELTRAPRRHGFLDE